MEKVQIKEPLDGGCLCGALRYRVRPGEADSAYCHCRMCQRSGGAPAMAWFSVPEDRFAYLQGRPVTYRSSAAAVREFCGRCGSPILFRPDGKAMLDVSTATLDAPQTVPPRFHIWRMSRLSWFETADSLPRFDDRGPDL